MSAQQVEQGAERDSILVRFRDNEIMEGVAPQLDLDRPDFDISISDRSSNNRTVAVPLTSVKSILLERREFEGGPDGSRLQKVVVHFWDGEILKGLLEQEPERRGHGMIVPLVSPALDEVEVFGIPYPAVKAVYYVKTWDSRGGEFVRETGRWTLSRVDTPLLDLLGEIRGLTKLRSRGHLSDAEYEKRRREVLERI